MTTAYGYDAAGNVTTVTDPKGNVMTYAYDKERRVTQNTGPAGTGLFTKYDYDQVGHPWHIMERAGVFPTLFTTMTYDARGKLATTTLPDGTVKTNTYDSVQRLSTETYSSGRQVLYNYDLASRPIKVTDQVSGTLDASITVNRGAVVRQQMTYYAGGLPATLKDAKGNTTTYYYDGFKRRYQIVYPDHSASASDFDLHGFDANGNELVFQRRDGTQIWSTYDALNRRLTKAPTNQPTVSYGYDYTGKLLAAQANGESAATQISYDTAGRKIGEYSWLFGWTTATLDSNGNRASLTYPASVGYTAAYDYDALNRLTGIYQNSVSSGPRIVGYSYDVLSQRNGASYGPASGAIASSTWAYNANTNYLTSINQNWNGASLQLGFTYNKDRQVTTKTASDNTFLPSGLGAASTSYTANNLNQYTALAGVGAATYVYDRRSNLTSDGVWTYGYDTENRLVSAAKSGTTVSYSYDALGRRMFKTVNGTTTAYASYGDQELAEYVGTGGTVNFARMFAYGPGLDEPVMSVAPGGARTYMFQDALGSVIALANASGQVTEKYAYTAYGLNTVTGTATAAYRFAGRRYDEETGLYFNRARAYSPTLGRFLQTDPIGTDGGINLYAYTGNDPVNATDPMGTTSTIGGTLGTSCAIYCTIAGGSVDILSASGLKSGSYNHQAFASSMQIAAAASFIEQNILGFGLGGPIEFGATKIAATEIIVSAAERARQIASALGSTERFVTIGVTETVQGVRLISSSESALRPAALSVLKEGEIAVTGLGHAEVTGVNAAVEMGLTPTGAAASRGICPSCVQFLKDNNVIPLGPLRK